MSLFRLFLLSHLLQIKRHLCTVLSSLRWVSLEETVMRVRMQCYGIFA